MSVFKKQVQTDKVQQEVLLQMFASNEGFSPNVQKIVPGENGTSVIWMDAIEGKTLYELYGDSPHDIPPGLWNRIRLNLQVLYIEYGIQYVDVTPYNFMMDNNNRLWIVDFGDATIHEKELNWFLVDLFDGRNEWNSDFA